MTHTITRIDLLRHGQPEGPDCMRGHVDPPLSAFGWQQMRLAVQQASGYQQVLSSDLSRCRRFAERFANERELPLQALPEFRELNFGEWDGAPYQQLWQDSAQALGDYWQDPWANTPPGGERMADFAARIDRAWEQLLADFSGQHILLVTHGGVIRHLMARILQMPLPGTAHISALSVPYAAKISVEVWHDEDGRFWPKILWPS